MTYCHGADSPYGCGHHAEHVRAARLGWLRRRRGQSFQHSRAQYYVSEATGKHIELAHSHPSHRGQVAFKSAGKWYTLPRGTFRELTSAGREIVRERERAERSQLSAERKAERVRAAEERMVRSVQRAEYGDVARVIRSAGGIHISKVAATGKTSNRGEIVASVPSSLRAGAGRGVSLDRAREAVNEHMPWLRLDTEDDLLRYLDRARELRARRAYMRRHAS